MAGKPGSKERENVTDFEKMRKMAQISPTNCLGVVDLSQLPSFAEELSVTETQIRMAVMINQQMHIHETNDTIVLVTDNVW